MLRVGGPFGDAARDALALRQASPGASRERCETKSASSLEMTANRETADLAP